MDGPASMEGAASGVFEGYGAREEGALTHTLRLAVQELSVPLHAKMLLPRLRRSRIWHCYTISHDVVEANGGVTSQLREGEQHACREIGPASVVWNGMAYKPLARGQEGSQEPNSPRGMLYVNDIFLRHTVEFAVVGSGSDTRLEQRRTFRSAYMVDNVHLDRSGEALLVGAVGYSHFSFWGAMAAAQTKAAEAHVLAQAVGAASPRPHLHLRPHPNAPPQPAHPSGAVRIDLASGTVSTELMQGAQLAAISFYVRVGAEGEGAKLVLGSPWDDGILVCPA
mmetsp:Transcript_30087/g.60350  ORF Transcript_30087/g.60350 Transcript_30087/m.60350 type:complete len:281 (-) Transcript_30087:129-971(-)